MADSKNTHELIIKSLEEKAGLKLDVFQNLESTFTDLKSILKHLPSTIKKEMSKVDKRVELKYIDRSPYDAEFRISDDILIFTLHTNIFTFEESHSIIKSSYVKEDPLRKFCGMISIYNFLSDSFNFNRMQDEGYLIARIFINSEMHFFVEGKRELGFLYNNFEKSVLNKETLRSIIESAILYSLNFDIYTPPFEQVQVLSVQDVVEKNRAGIVSTGKRLGFKFESDSDTIE
jgi:hypothetical protein